MTLKNSARNTTLADSWMVVDFWKEKSKFLMPSERSVGSTRGSLPNWYAVNGTVFVTGVPRLPGPTGYAVVAPTFSKQVGLNHAPACTRASPPPATFLLQPGTTIGRVVPPP